MEPTNNRLGRKGKKVLSSAIDKDPNYALAYVGLANSYIINDRPKEHNIKAKESAIKALELDPSLGEAHAILGNIAFWFEWDFQRSEAAFKKRSNSTRIIRPPIIGTAKRSGLLAGLTRADAEFSRAVELDPVSMAILTDQAMALIYARQFDRAIERLKENHQ